MMKRIQVVFATAAIALSAPAIVEAQQLPLAIEVRGGAYIPTGDFAEGVGTGFGLGGIVSYRVIPALDIYAGYSWQSFPIDDDEEFDDVDIDIEDSGFAVGVRFEVPAAANLGPWIRAGLILHQAKFSGSDGSVSVSFTSDRTAGLELGGGVAIPVTPNLSITPGVSFRTYKPTFDIAGEIETSDESLSYFGLEIGGRFTF
jgi:opacity protein-like surface antigen